MNEQKVDKLTVLSGRYRMYVPAEMDRSIFTEKNPYGFALNVNHPRVAKWYQQFKAEKKQPRIFPLSDDLRMEFETRIFNALGITYEILEKKGEKEHAACASPSKVAQTA